MKQYLIILSVLSLSLACNSGDKRMPEDNPLRNRNYDNYIEFKNVQSQNFVLSIPDFMEQAQGLNKHAVLQYASLANGFFLIAFDETKYSVVNYRLSEKDTFETELDYYINYHLKSQIAKEKELLDSVLITSERLNGLDVLIAQYSCLSEDSINAFRMMACYRSKKRFFMIFMWTLNEPEGSRDIMLKALRSLQEINE